MLKERIDKLLTALQAEKLEVIVLNPGTSFFYLTGLSFHLMERPVIGLFSRDEKPVLVVPELERTKAEGSTLDIEVRTYGEDETSRIQAFQSVTDKLNGRHVGVEPLRLRVFELRLLENVAPDAQFVSAASVLTNLRILKDEAEVQSMRRAVAIAEKALEATLPLVRQGMTERELEAELVVQLLRAGSETELPFSPIVASGPNSALPHATPTERCLLVGDLLILDWGARAQGYISDITRTFAIGEIDAELEKVYRIVQEANAAGREAVRPDVTCGQIDRASRAVIENAGYGEYFIHRTGHGIGLDAHEPPGIRADNDLRLAPGMTFTIEPGIYLPNKGGIRIEDNLIVSPNSGECLTSYSRDLEVIA